MRTTLFIRFAAFVAVFVLWGETSSQAGLTTYADVASWESVVLNPPYVNLTTVVIPDVGSYLGTGTASVIYGDVVFSTDGALSDSNVFNIDSNFSGAVPVLSAQNSTFGGQNILIEFTDAMHAFALNYGTFNGSSVTFLLSNGHSFTQGSTGSGYLVPDFAGVTDTESFTSVLITSNDFVMNIGDVSHATLSGSNAVPEPASLALLSLGGAALAAACRRSRQPRQIRTR